MKKESKLIYSIVICFLVYVLLSWIIPTGTFSAGEITTSSTNPVGLGGLLYYPALTLGTFIQFGLIVLAIGGLYGVMKRTKSYAKMIEFVVTKCNSKKKGLLIATILVTAILTSLFGCPYVMLILVPFMMDVLMELGYSKKIALVSTIGSILVGQVGSTFGYTIAGAAATTLGIDILSGLLSRVILLALVLFIFILFVLSKSNEKDKDSEAIYYEKESGKDAKKVRALPSVIVLVLLVVTTLVGMFTWNSVFNVTLFDDIATKLAEVKVLDNIIGLSANLGAWDSYELIGILVLASLLIGWLYNLKIKDIVDSFSEGAKKLLKPAFYVTIVNIIFTLMLVNQNNNMLVWILGKINTKGFNIVSVLGSSVIGSLFYNVFPYFFYNTAAILTNFYTAEYYNIIIFVGQAIYSIFMMILPTSIILVAGLSMLNISYKEWVKYIWKFLLEILLIVILISVILTLLV